MNIGYLESWLMTYMNLLLTLGLAVTGITVTALVTSRLVKFVCNEYKQYQPSAWMLMISNLLGSSIFVNTLISYILPPQSNNADVIKKITQLEKESISNTSKLVTKMNNIENLLNGQSKTEPSLSPSCSPSVSNISFLSCLLDPSSNSSSCSSTPSTSLNIPSHTCQSCPSNTLLNESANEIINCIIEGSVNLSKLDPEVKKSLIKSFIASIENIDYINKQLLDNNSELTGIIQRIGNNMHSILTVESNNNPELKAWLSKVVDFFDPDSLETCNYFKDTTLPLQAMFDILKIVNKKQI